MKIGSCYNIVDGEEISPRWNSHCARSIDWETLMAVPDIEHEGLELAVSAARTDLRKWTWYDSAKAKLQ
jgi:hypothetical protein